MIKFKHYGSFNSIEKWFNRMLSREYLNILSRYGDLGVKLLSEATPKESGKTADSWSFDIEHTSNSTVLSWSNSNVNDGVQIALILQYGHGTGTGGYVEGVDYINPALKPVFEKMADEVWKEVSR